MKNRAYADVMNKPYWIIAKLMEEDAISDFVFHMNIRYFNPNDDESFYKTLNEILAYINKYAI